MTAIENYLKTNAEFEAAKQALAAIAAGLKDFATQLSRAPENTCFSNTTVGLPAEIVASSSTKSYDASGWDTPEQIQTAIARRFEAKRKVQAAWAAVPSEMRASLVPPRL